MSNETKPRLPKIGEYVSGVGRLVEIRDVTPPPPPKAEQYVFEATEAQVEGRLNGHVMRKGPMNNYHYKPGSEVKGAKEDALLMADDIGPSEMVFVVRQTTYFDPRMALAYAEHPTDKTFLSMTTPHTACPTPKAVSKDVWELRFTAEGTMSRDLTEINTTPREN